MTDDVARTPRDELRDGLSSALTTEQVKYLLDEVLVITKQAWGTCGGCNKRVLVDIPDAKSVAGALKDLLAEGFGRPQAEAEAGDRIVFTRTIIYEGTAE